MGIIIRQSIKGIIVNYVGTFVGFLSTFFVVTRFLKPEEVGLTRVIYESADLVGSVAVMGVTSSAMRFFPYFKNPENKDNGFFFYLLLLPTFGSLICIPLYFIFKTPIVAYFEKNSSLYVDYYNWVVPLILFVVYWMTMETYAIQKLRIVIPKFIREIVVRVLLIAVYLSYAFGYLRLEGLVACFVLVYGIAMLLSFFYACRIGNVTLKHDLSYIDKDLRKKIFQYTLFLLFTVLGSGILNKLDIFMVSGELGLGYAGIYTVAFYMAAVIDIPSRSISSISSPLAASALKDGDFKTANDLYKKVSLHQLMVGSCIFLLIWINIDNIFKIMPNGEIYQAGKWVVFFIALSKLIGATLNFGGTLISFSKYYYWSLYFTVFITVLGILTNLLLIPRLGMSGAAIGSLISCVLGLSVQQWIVLRKIKGNPFSAGLLKQILLFSVLFVVNYFLLPKWSFNPWIDGIYRTFIIGSALLVAIYKMRLSEEICQIMDSSLNYLKKKI